MISNIDSRPVNLNSKNRNTLDKLLRKPRASDIRVTDVKSLVRSLNGVWDEKRDGSRIHIAIAGHYISIHNPHPGSELKTYQVKDLAEYFSNDIKQYLNEEYGYQP